MDFVPFPQYWSCSFDFWQTLNCHLIQISEWQFWMVKCVDTRLRQRQLPMWRWLWWRPLCGGSTLLCPVFLTLLCPIYLTLLRCAIFPCCQVGRSLWLIVKSTAGDVDQNQFTPTLHSSAVPYTFAFILLSYTFQEAQKTIVFIWSKCTKYLKRIKFHLKVWKIWTSNQQFALL